MTSASHKYTTVFRRLNASSNDSNAKQQFVQAYYYINHPDNEEKHGTFSNFSQVFNLKQRD